MVKNLFGDEINTSPKKRGSASLDTELSKPFQGDLHEELDRALKEFKKLGGSNFIREEKVIKEDLARLGVVLKHLENDAYETFELGDQFVKKIEILQKYINQEEKLKLELKIRNLLDTNEAIPTISDEAYAKMGIIIHHTRNTLIKDSTRELSSTELGKANTQKNAKPKKRKDIEERVKPTIECLEEFFGIDKNHLYIAREVAVIRSSKEPYYLISFKHQGKDINILVCNQYANSIYVLYDTPFVPNKTKEELKKLGAKKINSSKNYSKIILNDKKSKNKNINIRKIKRALTNHKKGENPEDFIKKLKEHIANRLEHICPVLERLK